MNPIQAQLLLMKCAGDEIWSVDACRQEGVPESWIEELSDTFESGFDNNTNTIYEQGKLVNHYHGVSDLQLAYKLAEYLNVDWQTVTQFALTRRDEVRAIKEAVEEE